MHVLDQNYAFLNKDNLLKYSPFNNYKELKRCSLWHLKAKSFFFDNVFIKKVVGHNLRPTGYQNSSTFMPKS